MAGFAACHIGEGSEAGTGNLFVKFGVVRPDQSAPATFARLIDACESVAAEAGCQEINAGVNTGRHQAYCYMIDRGFRTFFGRRGNAAAKRARLQSSRLLRH